jgi:hypothetical protein
MIRPNTVFVLGAGASHELGFPLGKDLRQKIKDICARRQRHDGFGALPTELEETFGTLKTMSDELGFATQEVSAAQRSLQANLDSVDSIDQFLGLHTSNPSLIAVGKLAIAYAIGLAEAASSIYWDQRQTSGPVFSNPARASDSYLQRLWVLLSDGLDAETIDRVFQGAAFVSFNYDRSLEYFFYVRLRQLLNLPHERASSIVASMIVVRPYGSIGRGPCDQRSTEGEIMFGAELNRSRLSQASKQIRVISDDRLMPLPDSEVPGVAEGKRLLSNSDHVVFLGCAYHQSNIEVLSLSKAGSDHDRTRKIWGTAHGIDDIALPHIVAELHRALRAPSTLIDLSNKHTAATLCEALKYALRLPRN